MLRIALSHVNGRLIRNTFCYGSEVVPVQCKRSQNLPAIDVKAEKICLVKIYKEMLIFRGCIQDLQLISAPLMLK